jgi:hypothetical protein
MPRPPRLLVGVSMATRDDHRFSVFLRYSLIADGLRLHSSILSVTDKQKPEIA